MFAEQVEVLENARGALMSCLPVGRVEPAPVAVGLDLLADTLDDLSGRLDQWRHEDIDAEWRACSQAIAEARAGIPSAHDVASSSGELEELLGAIDEVDEPLGRAFGDAARAFRRRRR